MKRTRTHSRTNKWHIWRVVARMWSEKFPGSERSFYNIRSDFVLHSCLIQWTMGHCGSRKKNNKRSMLPLNRTHKYENILNFEKKKEGKKASESSACIVHAEAHTNANCNRFIDCNLSRLSFSCFVLFYFAEKKIVLAKLLRPFVHSSLSLSNFNCISISTSVRVLKP